MQFKSTALEGLVEIFPRTFTDERGFFLETYQRQSFANNGVPYEFMQDNQSFSHRNVLRGLHFQREPFAQGKLVRVVSGKVLDVVVDLRENSATFGEHAKFVLDARQQNMLYVPTGFAHGFLTLEDAVFCYKCTNYYNRSAESGIRWNDAQLNIYWGIENPIVSDKDAALPSWHDLFARK